MSSILPPSNRLWWKESIDKTEWAWITIAFVWGMVMFVMMIYWHIYGKQNLSNEAYKTTPEAFAAKAEPLPGCNGHRLAVMPVAGVASGLNGGFILTIAGRCPATFARLSQAQVDNAGNRVRAILCRCTVAQDFYPI